MKKNELVTVRPPIDMPPMPRRIAALPRQDGYPVPWFVAKSEGRYDFRIVDQSKFAPAIKQRKCWICGQKLGAHLGFVIGPMCVINRISSEPPSHRECCEWALKVCPFLLQRQTYRNDANLSDHLKQPAGIHIDRKPGVSVLWMTNSFEIDRVPNGILFALGEPTDITWHRKGRPATRTEILDSIESGYLLLLELAQADGEAGVRELEKLRDRAMPLLPAN